MSIPREFIELLLTKIDLVDLINTQVPLRKKSANNYFARCPFHQEKSASFSVSQTKQFYYCFGCGAHGNAIDFMMQHDRMTFPEAVVALAKFVGMEIPQSEGFLKKEDNLIPLYDLMKDVAAFYYEQMRTSERAIGYLKKRGISGSIARQFMLGFAPNAWSNVLDTFGKSNSEQKKLLTAGLIIQKNEGGYYDRFRDRIMFPIHDYRGRIIGFGGRIIDEGEPKYLNSPETPLFQKGHELYGLHHALKTNRKLDRIIIVEGYMDVIALFQHNITYAVATLGTATTSHHLQRLFRYTSEIIFCFDGDTAGRNAAWRALLVLLPLMHDSLQVRFLFLPEGEDPDSMIQKIGKIAFETLLHDAMSLSLFFFQHLSEQSDMNTLEGRARFAASSLNLIKTIPPGIFQGILLEELSKRARVDINELKQQIKSSEETLPSAIHPATDKQSKTKLPASLRLALGLLIQQPHLATLVEAPITLPNLPGVNFLNTLIETIKKSPYISTGGLLELWRGQKEEPFLAKLAQWDHMVPEDGFKNEFLDAVRQLTMLSFDDAINRLLAKAANLGLTEGEKLELAQFIAKKKAILS